VACKDFNEKCFNISESYMGKISPSSSVMPQCVTYFPCAIYKKSMDEAVYSITGESGHENFSGDCNMNNTVRKAAEKNVL
jgi:hypothetical protein